jgi:phospholipid/cholesterol/gamma-HCH transport system substrate-binding protein
MKLLEDQQVGVAGFVLLGLGALAFLLTQVTNQASRTPQGDGYHLAAVFDDIGELKVGARVTMAGVDIGRVSHTDLDATAHKAIVSIELKREFNQIPDDSSASINTQGILGGQFIQITSGVSVAYLRTDGRIRTTHSAMSIETTLRQLTEEK